MLEINRNPTPRELRQFSCLGLPGAMVIVGTLLYFKTQTPTVSFTLWGLALLLATVGWFVPRATRPVYIGFIYAVFPIGWTVSHLILAAIYYGLMTPLGVMMKAFGYDPMTRKPDRAAQTHWVPRDPVTDPRRYFRQF